MPRIRSLKPELWQDEAMEELSRDARLLFVGLITQADDAGRLRGSNALLRSLVFPYDTDLAGDDIDRWLDELTSAGLAQRYESGGTEYLVLPGWHNQKIDRPSPSRLPDPPEPDPSTNDRRTPVEPSPRPRSGSEGIKDQGKDQGSDASVPTSDVPSRLEPHLATLTAVVAGKAQAKPLNVRAVVKACLDFTDRDLATEADKFRHYWLDGAGENRELKDVAGAWRNWLRRAPRASTVARNGTAPKQPGEIPERARGQLEKLAEQYEGSTA